jgi:hypothetical protein
LKQAMQQLIENRNIIKAAKEERLFFIKKI